MKIILFLLAVMCYDTVAAEIELTYYAKSEHFSSVPYNQNHDFIGLTLRDKRHGFNVAYFKNSYFKKSVLVAYSRYWQPYKDIELNITGGAVTGYSGLNECKKDSTSGYFCPAFEAGIKYTKYKYMQPKLSIFSGALVLSLSARF